MSPALVNTGVAVLVNPQAGLTKADDGNLQRILGERGFVTEAGTGEELAAFVEAVRRERVGVVCVCGGDGTLGRVAGALVSGDGEHPVPAIAPIGGGTMNTIARSLGLRRTNPAWAMERVLAGGDRVAEATRSTMRINRDRLGFMFGAGVPARFLRLYEEGSRLGHWRAARVLGDLIGSAAVGGKAVREMFTAIEGSVVVDGHDLGLRRISMVYAAVIDDIGLGFKPTPRGHRDDARFELLAADARPFDLVKALPRLRFGDGIGGDPWVDVCAESVSIRLKEPIPYMIDGDVEGPVRDLEVRTGPSFKVLIAR